MAESEREHERITPRRRRRLEVDIQQSDEPMDAVAWARSYVLAVLRLEDVAPPAGPVTDGPDSEAEG